VNEELRRDINALAELVMWISKEHGPAYQMAKRVLDAVGKAPGPAAEPAGDVGTKGVLYLPSEYTRLAMTEADKEEAIELAYRVTLSPHEWTWTDKEATRMAMLCLWAMQRLNIIRRFTTTEPAVSSAALVVEGGGT
jgi:hypothetical protein